MCIFIPFSALFVLSPDCGTHTGNQSWLTNFYRVQLRSQIDTNGEYKNDIDCYQHVIVTRNFGVHITFTYLEVRCKRDVQEQPLTSYLK